jgi:soluble lytic murein transglycosylase-like protein
LAPGDERAHRYKEYSEDDGKVPSCQEGAQGEVRTLPPMRNSMNAFLIGAMLAFCVGSAAPAAAATKSHLKSLPVTPKVVNIYAAVLRSINRRMPDWLSRELARHLLMTAAHWHIDANMLAAVVTVESRWRTHAVSYAGAIGLGQLMPGTAATLDVNPRDPRQNLSGAARYLSGLAQRFSHKTNRYALTFAAYNAGPEAVAEFGGIPPYYQTQNYVTRVLATWHHFQRTVRIPRSALVATVTPAWELAHGADVDYWLKTR